jgi:UDP-2,3-diacylglucosamine pyrophosphatase LpxH
MRKFTPFSPEGKGVMAGMPCRISWFLNHSDTVWSYENQNFVKPPRLKTHYSTIVISDLHLGISNAHPREVIHFLRRHTCDTFILNGDIIDGWQLARSGKWKKKHTAFFRLIMKWLSSTNTRIIYLRGNHDDFLDEVLPLEIGNFSIVRTHIHESLGRRYYVVHGDIFDSVTTKLKWVAKLGDVGYTFLLWLNRHYNRYRNRRGLPYYSLSQVVKLKVKQAVSFITDFESTLCEVARIEKCDGVICGHIHQPAVKELEGIQYLNSGDWVESLSALVETKDGEWKVIHYQEWLAEQKDSETDEANVDEQMLEQEAWLMDLQMAEIL